MTDAIRFESWCFKREGGFHWVEIPAAEFDIVARRMGYDKWPFAANAIKGEAKDGECPVDTIRRIIRERDDATAALSGLSSYLGAGLGEDSTTAEQYVERIKWGVDHHAKVAASLAGSSCHVIDGVTYRGNEKNSQKPTRRRFRRSGGRRSEPSRRLCGAMITTPERTDSGSCWPVS